MAKNASPQSGDVYLEFNGGVMRTPKYRASPTTASARLGNSLFLRGSDQIR